jgi:hypothetical protein
MTFWRVWAALLGSSLLLTAYLMGKPSFARHCAFSAAFAATAGMLYGSFGKLQCVPK